MRTALAIARTAVLRLIRDRSNIFFVFIFPLMLVLLIGLAFGDAGQPVVGAVVDDSAVGERLVAALEDQDLVVDRYDDGEVLREDVARGTVDAGLILRDDADPAGGAVEFVPGPDASGALLRTTVDAAAAEVGNEARAVAAVVERIGMDAAQARQLVTAVAAAIPALEVEVSEAGETAFEGFEELGTFGFGAVGQLLLFVFLTSLTGSAALIQTRQLGVARRMLAAPVHPLEILAGQALGRFAVALIQALYIILGTALIFGVQWGDPVATGLIVVVFALVSSAAGMVVGAVLSNDAQAGGIGVLVGLGAAALGGSMLPLEFFSPTMRTVAHITPHAWAQDAFADLLRRGGTTADILPELAVLTAMGVWALAIGSWALHRAVVRP